MSKLYIVPTPIGNLDDITLRALKILKEVDFILAEDTRNTGILLKHFGIEKPLVAYHQHNEHKITERMAMRIIGGETAALVSDAGTPAISDPGFMLVRECIKNDIPVETLPGASAILPALVNSGLPCDRFLFEGFLPLKKGRKSRMEFLKNMPCAVVLYESPHRVLKTLVQLAEHFGNERRASISRELTKIYEETIRGTLEELISHFQENPVRGEFVIVVEGIK
nr:16S rRNA (cytidine(1402)-2'-O)-methyltransferase [Bacteroidota bacterium]